MTTAAFTDLLRNPEEVLAHIDEDHVRLTRRDGDDLVILRAHDLDILVRGIGLSSRVIGAISRNRGNVPAALSELFAWAVEFSPEELAAYAVEIERMLYTASELGTFEPLLRAQQELQETATAHATGLRPVVPTNLPARKRRVARP